MGGKENEKKTNDLPYKTLWANKHLKKWGVQQSQRNKDLKGY